MKFLLGDRVLLITNEYPQGYANPVRGSKFEMTGTITEFKHDRYLNIRVLWDNKRTNVYKSSDLKMVEDFLPEKLFEI